MSDTVIEGLRHGRELSTSSVTATLHIIVVANHVLVCVGSAMSDSGSSSDSEDFEYIPEGSATLRLPCLLDKHAQYSCIIALRRAREFQIMRTVYISMRPRGCW